MFSISFLTKQQAVMIFFELVSMLHVYGLTKYAVRSNQHPPLTHTHTNKPVKINTISGSQKNK